MLRRRRRPPKWRARSVRAWRQWQTLSPAVDEAVTADLAPLLAALG